MSSSQIPSVVRILLIEDDDAHAELVQIALEEGRVTNPFMRVRSGEEALEYLHAHPNETGCIFLDIKLPRMSGMEVLEQIRASSEPRVRSLPVIMLTTLKDDHFRERAYELHVNSFVQKPLDFDSFQRVVQDLQMYWCIHNVQTE